MTHDYRRHGTTDLVAALNAPPARSSPTAGGGTPDRRAALLPTHRPPRAPPPRRLLGLDDLSAHTAPEVQKWLAHRNGPAGHLHFIPTSSSWLNLVERWFKELTDRRLRRGTFTSVPALVEAIETWVEHWNDDPKPFVWRKNAEENHHEGPPR